MIQITNSQNVSIFSDVTRLGDTSPIYYFLNTIAKDDSLFNPILKPKVDDDFQNKLYELLNSEYLLFSLQNKQMQI